MDKMTSELKRVAKPYAKRKKKGHGKTGRKMFSHAQTGLSNAGIDDTTPPASQMKTRGGT